MLKRRKDRVDHQRKTEKKTEHISELYFSNRNTPSTRKISGENAETARTGKSTTISKQPSARNAGGKLIWKSSYNKKSI